MRIKSVEMAWFRGAAGSVTHDTALKSTVIYGENGAGKSSFIDTIEFVMSGGKIRHLAHEYSGKRQEKGIVNTHKPESEKTKLTIVFDGGAQDVAEIESDGRCTFAGISTMKDWDLGRTILRQNEVADFIHGTKGQKYTALLPLFGLQELENDVRKIMDIELALIAEKLQIRMPYMRAERNDRRMAHDFLERIVADGEKCLQKKGAKDYEGHAEAIDALKLADQFLLSWANRASHTFDLVRGEATKLIEVCEKALGFFKCSVCGKSIAFADAEAKEWTQCQCGSIRWRYGKG